MIVKQYEIWIADLNPRIGTGPGKTRPVLVVQTDLLNKISHPSTLVCPITTKINKDSEILRIHIERDIANVREKCDIMIDQLRAIDNKRFEKKIGKLPRDLIDKVKENIMIVMDIDF